MALQFNGIEAIRFGKTVALPKVDAETRLRLQALKLNTKESVTEAIEVLSSCFGAESYAVKQFMTEQMTEYELAQVQAYLLGGESMLEMLDKQFEKNLGKDNG